MINQLISLSIKLNQHTVFDKVFLSNFFPSEYYEYIEAYSLRILVVVLLFLAS